MKIRHSRFFVSFFMFLALTLHSLFAYAETTPPTPFSQIIFFGDSLTDNGNFYNDVYGFMPKSPPYFDGRFSNGPVWSEYTSQYFFAKSQVESTNYAIGGQTAVFHNPIDGFNPYTLTMSRENYLLHTIFTDRSKTLFIIWVGANDYLPGIKDLDSVTTNVVDSIRSTIESLIYYGGTNFLIIDLPDLSKLPYGQTIEFDDVLKAAVVAHNLKLDAAIADLQQGYKNVNINQFKFDQLFEDFIKNTDDYNQKYHMNITNKSESCWTGGYTLRPTVVTEDMIKRNIDNHLRTQSKTLSANAKTPTDTAALAHYIATTPALMETFVVSDNQETGVKPCSKPDQYMFWDKVHPTADMHKLIAQKINEFIDQHYQSGAKPENNHNN